MLNVEKEFKELCQRILDASLFWTGQDENLVGGLKTIRTLAGYYLDVLKEKEEEKLCEDL